MENTAHDVIKVSDLEKLSAMSERFLQIVDEDLDFQQICDDMLEISGAKYTIFNLYDGDGRNYSTVAISGELAKIKKASTMLGFELVGQKRQQNQAIHDQIMEKNITLFPSLTELAGNSIKKQILKPIEKAFNIGTCYFVKISKNDILLGDFQLLMEKNQGFNNEILVEIYSRQVGLIISRQRAEEKVKQEKLFTDALIEALPGYLYVYNEAGHLIRWNKKHEEMTGYTPEELSQMTMDKWFEGDDAIRVAAAVNQVFKTGHGEVEANLLIKGGGKRRILSSGVRLTLDGKNYLTGVGMDITERRLAEEALRESEQHYKYLFEDAGLGVSYYKPDGTVVYYNKKAAENMGGHPRDYEGKSIYDLFPISDADFYMSRIKKAITMDAAQEYTDFVRLEPGQKWFSSVFNRIMNQKGEVVGVQIISRDITEAKDTEEALRKNRDYLESLLKYANAPIIVWDAELKITIFNRAFEQLSGHSFEEVFGKRVENLLPETKRKSFLELVKRTSGGGRWETEEIEIQDKAGIIHTLLWNSATLYSSDGKHIEATIAQGHDITERKKAEKEIVFLNFHDHLTGLYNRRFYEEELRRLDTERNLPIVLVMADVNGLKLTNDAFGHKFGDQLLIRISDFLKRECRGDEIVARIGGDEFVLLLPKTTAEEAKKLINRISNAIEKERVDNIVLSISMGFAVKESISEQMDEVFKRAEDDMYRHKLSESSSMRSKTIDLIMNSLFEKNDREMHHSKRVSEICEAIASEMNFAKFEVNQIKTAGLMHDIGKIAIGNHILNKEGSLTSEEWEEIKRHPEVGYRILNSADEFSEIAGYALEHQERWDGKGYPNGLKGEEIAVEARIIAVADAYDAMTIDRPYRKKMCEEEAIVEMKQWAGHQFDPEIVRIFVEKVLKKKL